MFSTKPCGVCDTSSASFIYRKLRSSVNHFNENAKSLPQAYSYSQNHRSAAAISDKKLYLGRVPCILSDVFVMIWF